MTKFDRPTDLQAALTLLEDEESKKQRARSVKESNERTIFEQKSPAESDRTPRRHSSSPRHEQRSTSLTSPQIKQQVPANKDRNTDVTARPIQSSPFSSRSSRSNQTSPTDLKPQEQGDAEPHVPQSRHHTEKPTFDTVESPASHEVQPKADQKTPDQSALPVHTQVSPVGNQNHCFAVKSVNPNKLQQGRLEAVKTSVRPHSRGKKRSATEMEGIVRSIESQDGFPKVHNPCSLHLSGPSNDARKPKRKCPQDQNVEVQFEQFERFIATRKSKKKRYDKFDLMREIDSRDRVKERLHDVAVMKQLELEFQDRGRTINALQKDLEAEKCLHDDAQRENQELDSITGELEMKNGEIEKELAEQKRTVRRLLDEFAKCKEKTEKKSKNLLQAREALQHASCQIASAEACQKQLDRQLKDKAGLAAEARNESVELKSQLKTATENFNSLREALHQGKTDILESLGSSRESARSKFESQVEQTEKILESLEDLKRAFSSEGTHSSIVGDLKGFIQPAISGYVLDAQESHVCSTNAPSLALKSVSIA